MLVRYYHGSSWTGRVLRSGSWPLAFSSWLKTLTSQHLAKRAPHFLRPIPSKFNGNFLDWDTNCFEPRDKAKGQELTAKSRAAFGRPTAPESRLPARCCS